MNFLLKIDAVEDNCHRDHDAIHRFVSRLPKAVFGASVSPLMSKAATSGDVFKYPIDGDPNLTPP